MIENFKLIRTYHKPYRIFKEKYIVNIGNINPIVKNHDNITWLKNNMDKCYDISDKDSCYCEFIIWKTFLDSDIQDIDSYISLQHYSKILDLNSIQTIPYKDNIETEDKNGIKFSNCTTLSEFGYTNENIKNILNNYDLVVGNQYPCNIILSIKNCIKENYEDVLKVFAKIIHRDGYEIFNLENLQKYLTEKYQYWRGGPLITTTQNFKYILDFSFKIINAFILDRNIKDSTYFGNNDIRGPGYLFEIILGFAIYCLIEDFKTKNKRIGYCRLLTDSSVVYSYNNK